MFDPNEGQLYRKVTPVTARKATEAGFIETLEGPMSYDEGDYILGPGAAGEFWPVKPEVFEATYVLDSGLEVLPPFDPDSTESAQGLQLLKADQQIVDLTAQVEALQATLRHQDAAAGVGVGKLKPSVTEAGAVAAERRRRRELKLMPSSRLVALIMKFDGRTRATLNRLDRAALEDTVIEVEAKVRATREGKGTNS